MVYINRVVSYQWLDWREATKSSQVKKMGRSPCCDESGLKKGPWTPEEDQKLMNYIQKNGHGSWRALPKLAGTDPLMYTT